MYKGGTNYTKRSALAFRLAGLSVPIILLAYGVLIQFGIVKSPHSIDNIGLIILSFWWLYVSILHFIAPSKTKLDACLRLIAYHLLTGSYLVFISGVASPFVAGWLILMIASYAIFANRGLQLSTLSFVVIICLDILLWHRLNTTIVVYDLVALIIILTTGIITMGRLRSQEMTKLALTRSEAKESLQRNRIITIVNNLTDAVLSTDEHGIIHVYNAASLNLLDTNDSLNGHHIDNVMSLTNQTNEAISLFKELQRTKTVIKRDDLSFSFDDGEKMRLEITYSPIRSSYSRSTKTQNHEGYIIIMRDVTKSKSLEEERDEFISVTSHELRTPITIAEGTLSNVQIMLDHPDVTHDMLKEAVDTAHEQIIFLAHMVNDLSTLSRAERGVADGAEDIDVRELGHKLHDKYIDEAKTKKLHLNLDLSPKLGKVHVSRLYLEELLQNFITNSIKYTKTGSITIIISQKAGEVTFAVKDTGIGVSKSDQAKIFDKFYRSEDYRTRETGGTGLGLYVAAKLARKVGTKIQLSSRLNFGSTFSFTLPTLKD